VPATQEEIISGLAEIIEEVTGIEPSEVTPEKSFVDDLDIDSYIQKLEEENPEAAAAIRAQISETK
jgi:acyl carrier protein